METLREEFRDPKKAKQVSSKINEISKQTGKVRLMNVCGTHEMTIVKHGLRHLLSDNVHLIAGPGCPVCVTPAREIDEAVELARQGKIVTTFGDMYRVPGSSSSLADAKTRGGDVKIVYGISDAVEIARENSDRKVVHVAIGFETTAPTTASVLLKEPPENFSLLVCHRLIPPVMDFLLTSSETKIDGYLDPGHVSTIIGSLPYEPLSERFEVPQVVAGFEPLDVLLAVLMLLQQIKGGKSEVENEYKRFVRPEGNNEAKCQMRKVFETTEDTWRGFPKIPWSKLRLRKGFESYDARKKFDISTEEEQAFQKGCRCGEILKDLIQPPECPLFLKGCTPNSPMGPCMVSDEGTCAVWAKHSGKER